jgi:protease YdgD
MAAPLPDAPAPAAFSTAVRSVNVFKGSDTRREVPGMAWPWRAAGRLIAPGKEHSHCSGSLVAPDIVLTAAHCVLKDNYAQYTRPAGRLLGGPIVFQAGYNRGSFLAQASVKQFTLGTYDPGKERGSDWALLRIAAPIGLTPLKRLGGEKIGWFAVSRITLAEMVRLKAEGKLYLAGYHTDIGHAEIETLQSGCRFMETWTHLAAHNCSATRGSSGAAMILETSAGAKRDALIVALNIGERRDGGAQSLTGIPYASEHANVAIPTAAFFDELERMRQQAF